MNHLSRRHGFPIPLHLIAAYDQETRGIGAQGSIPWEGRLSQDLSHFKKITTQTIYPNQINAVIMGRKTWDSLPASHRPLSKRLNVVVSRQATPEDLPERVEWCSSLDQAIDFLKKVNLDIGSTVCLDQAFIIGGESIYREALQRFVLDSLYLTEVNANVYDPTLLDQWEFDTWFPEIPTTYQEISNQLDDEKKCLWITYQHQLTDEISYLRLGEELLLTGQERSDRTGVGTYSIFAPTPITFDLQGQIPVLTTKKVAWKTLCKELLWFLRGSTNAKELSAEGCRIWDGNTSRQFLDTPIPGQREALTHLEEGDIGKGYGFQWRHSGATYRGMHEDYQGEGFDQIAYVIDQIRNYPTSRRILLNAWSPSDMAEMALPPCHMMVQFYVDPVEKTLSAQMYQRSADVFLGVPFNIASYALLTYMIAHVTDLQPKKLTLVFGDAHLYSNHLDQMRKQMQRRPYRFPQLWLNPEIKNIDDFRLEDIRLENYQSHPGIKAPMAV